MNCTVLFAAVPAAPACGESSVRVLGAETGACVGIFALSREMLKAWLCRFGLCRVSGGSAGQHVLV